MQVTKLFLLIFISLIFVSCSKSNLTFDYSKKEDKISIGKIDKILNVELENSKFVYNSSDCVFNSYTLNANSKEYGKLFVEQINLENQCSWNGLPTSFLETNFKDVLKLDELKVVEEFDIGTYNFKTYKLNDNEYVSLIYLYGGFKDIFLIDYDGKLYEKLLKSMKPDYTNKFSENRLTKEYSDSLVKKNIINHYFSREVVIENQ